VIGGKGEVLREGTNGWTCLGLNPRPFPESGWKEAHDAMPGCDDAGVRLCAPHDSVGWLLQLAGGVFALKASVCGVYRDSTETI